MNMNDAALNSILDGMTSRQRGTVMDTVTGRERMAAPAQTRGDVLARLQQTLGPEAYAELMNELLQRQAPGQSLQRSGDQMDKGNYLEALKEMFQAGKGALHNLLR